MEEPRALTLLKATKEFLTNVRAGGNSDAMCLTAHYDDADCDGYCLLDDIEACLEEYTDSQTEQEKLENARRLSVFIPIAKGTPEELQAAYNRMRKIMNEFQPKVVPMLPPDFKEKFTQYLMSTLDTVYCDNCRGNDADDNTDPDFCEDCHRKYMSWELSRPVAEIIAEKALEMFRGGVDDAGGNDDATGAD